MALKRPTWPAGRVVTLEHTSKVLADNPLGDPHVRTLDVWLPPQYDQAQGRGRGERFPVLFDLVELHGQRPLAHGLAQLRRERARARGAARSRAQDRAGHRRVPRLLHGVRRQPVRQLEAVGRYADYLTRELVPFVDRELRTLAAREHRGCFGKSSGGYGALIHAMKYARYWGAAASHSGDAGFDFIYAPEWPSTLDELARHRLPQRVPGEHDVRAAALAAGDDGADDGRIARFLAHVWAKRQPSGAEIHSAHEPCDGGDLRPRPESAERLSRAVSTSRPASGCRSAGGVGCATIPSSSSRATRGNLRTLRGLFIDCGWRDQYRIHYGSRQLSLRLAEQRVPHVYEEFDGTHSGVDYRMERSLPFLARALR